MTGGAVEAEGAESVLAGCQVEREQADGSADGPIDADDADKFEILVAVDVPVDVADVGRLATTGAEDEVDELE